jgi:hypothetical protein
MSRDRFRIVKKRVVRPDYIRIRQEKLHFALVQERQVWKGSLKPADTTKLMCRTVIELLSA